MENQDTKNYFRSRNYVRSCYINIREVSFLANFSLKLLTLDYGESKLFHDRCSAKWNIL